MKKVVCIADNSYTLLLALLLIDVDINRIIFIFGENLKNIQLDKILIPKERKNYILDRLNQYIFFKKILIKNEIKEIYGNDHIRGANFFLNQNIDFKMIEDGTINYIAPTNYRDFIKKRSFFKLFLCFLFRIQKPYGLSDKVTKIYLTGLGPIPKEIYEKVELINLKRLWNRKTIEQKEKILNVFSFDSDLEERIKGKKTILFTQPLSEDNVISEIEKIEIYSKILKKYCKNEIVIKTHPREITNYRQIFKNYLILDNPFPFEIMSLLNIKFKKAVTLFSTAALTLGEDVEVDFYGTEVHENIFKIFGDCKNIKETNKTLEE